MSLFDVREAISKIINATDSTDIRTKSLIEVLRANHAGVISAARVELENMALTKIVNDVAARRHASRLPGQLDLFGGYSGIPQTIVLKGIGSGGKLIYTRKAIEHATPVELEAWLGQHTQARVGKAGKYAGMQKLLADAKAVDGGEHTPIGVLVAEKQRRELSK